jgi:23S rRNA (guanosine2251-2'-O)-methyltransferase
VQNVYLILDNIRSAYNVGSMLRTADAAGVKKVYMCGCTPMPIDRFGRKRPDIAKVALGAEEAVSSEYVADIVTLIQKLKQEGVSIVAVEQDTSSIPYTQFRSEKSVALILGEETKGILPSTLGLCDAIIEIPMNGKKESLNVSVTAGIVLFRLVEHTT